MQSVSTTSYDSLAFIL